MENKLQELTQKLYEEGLSKGRKEADTVLADAKAQAKKIVDEAQAEAAKIRKDAEAAADDLRKNTLTELNLAGKQVIGKLKGEIESIVVAKATGESVAKANMDPKFIQEMLVAVAKNWQGSSSDKVSLSALLPKDKEAEIGKELEKSLAASLGEDMEITWSNGQKSGFRIGPKNGGYYISFSDDSFNALLSEYLRPKVNEMLYGKQE